MARTKKIDRKRKKNIIKKTPLDAKCERSTAEDLKSIIKSKSTSDSNKDGSQKITTKLKNAKKEVRDVSKITKSSSVRRRTRLGTHGVRNSTRVKTGIQPRTKLRVPGKDAMILRRV